MDFEKRKHNDDLSLSNLQLQSVRKQSDIHDLQQKCLSIRKILFDENIGQVIQSGETDRFSFQEKIFNARHQADRPEKSNHNLSHVLPLVELRKMLVQIADYPDKKFNDLPEEYLNDLVELAQIINYRIKLQ